MLEDTFESMEDGEDMEEAVEEEVDKILFEITAGDDMSGLHMYFLGVEAWYTCDEGLIYKHSSSDRCDFFGGG